VSRYVQQDEAPADEPPADPRDADERARDHARQLAELAAGGDMSTTWEQAERLLRADPAPEPPEDDS
jgi:hypothetical protein